MAGLGSSDHCNRIQADNVIIRVANDRQFADFPSTVTTSAASTTTAFSTVRILTTETITQTATTTVGPLVARAANIAAIAEDIINSVLVSGVSGNATAEATATPTKNEQRIQAESGLANACSCKLVAPTSTVTSSFPLNPVVS